METSSKSSKNVLVAPLNWGLGHATRCIPIIRALENDGFVPILASDGVAIELLRKEFPHLKTLELPSYRIRYPRNGNLLRLKLIFAMPQILSAVRNERKIVEKWVDDHQLVGIISDNRFGVRSEKVPSVYVTHQLNVLSGISTFLTSAVHQMIVKSYDQCWVPDSRVSFTLSGKLGNLKKPMLNVKHIGPLSRFQKRVIPIEYDLMILLSGPEPHRGILEEKLRSELANFTRKVIFVAGKVDDNQKIEKLGNVVYYNFMLSEELENALNSSRLIICRSGYSTIMDLATLGKKAFFIPTPGQTEQEYLARKFSADGLAAYMTQDNFRLSDIGQADEMRGLHLEQSTRQLATLFDLFKGK